MKSETIRPKVLIVEDDHEFRGLCRRAFESCSFEVRESNDSMDGIVQSVEFRPDIILLDLMMPDVDGYEFIAAIRNNSDMNVPIVVYSGVTEGEKVHEALEVGADEFLYKSSCTPKEAVQKVQYLLDRKN